MATSMTNSRMERSLGQRHAVHAVAFRDLDRIWHRIDKTGFNKVGYITRRNTVIHPHWNKGLIETPLSRVLRYPHQIVEWKAIPSSRESENIEKFFTGNVLSIELFYAGLHALLTQTDFRYFERPIRLPILEDISVSEFEQRWCALLGILRPADLVMIIDTKSVISKLIARFDHGTWSHVGCYSGKGTVLEAITAGVVERDILVYHNPRYRLGVYRGPGMDSDHAAAMIAWERTQLGKPYGFRKVIRLGLLKLLGLWPRTTGSHNVSPNDLARSERLRLEYIV